jgi:hypothetical protein
MTWMTLTKAGRMASHTGVPALKDLQKAVGGYVEVFDLDHGVSMWCNEEAKIDSTLLGGTQTRMELENVKATHLITNHGPGLFPNDYIGGDRRLSSPVRHEVVEITEVAPPLASAG